jgi:hypothetical protein
LCRSFQRVAVGAARSASPPAAGRVIAQPVAGEDELQVKLPGSSAHVPLSQAKRVSAFAIGERKLSILTLRVVGNLNVRV